MIGEDADRCRAAAGFGVPAGTALSAPFLPPAVSFDPLTAQPQVQLTAQIGLVCLPKNQLTPVQVRFCRFCFCVCVYLGANICACERQAERARALRDEKERTRLEHMQQMQQEEVPAMQHDTDSSTFSPNICTPSPPTHAHMRGNEPWF